MRTGFARCSLIIALIAAVAAPAWADSVVPVTPHAWCYASATAFNPGLPDPPPPVIVEDWNHASATLPGDTYPKATLNCDPQANGSLLVSSVLIGFQSATAYAKIIRDDTHDSYLTIGTSAEYPAGTPLLLNIAAQNQWGFADLKVFRADGTELWRYYYITGNETTTVGVVAGENIGLSLDASYDTHGETAWLNATFSVATPEPMSLGLLLAAGLLLRRR